MPLQDDRVALVLPAAGAGRRMGGERKQFRALGQEPVFVHAIRAFDEHPAVVQLVVVCPPDAMDETAEQLETARLETARSLVPGGKTRTESVACGVAAVDADIRFIAVHDAVRPFVSRSLIDRVLAAARESGAAAPAIPSTDTLRIVSDGRFASTVPRGQVYRMQTPQVFRRAVLNHALARCTAPKPGHPAEPVTDDVELVLRDGGVVRYVEGDAANVKLTTPEDWAAAAQRLTSAEAS